MVKMIYSDYMECMIVAGFTVTKTYEDGKVVSHHYTWNEIDLVYYNDDVDGVLFDELPTEKEKKYDSFRGSYVYKVEYDK